MRERVDGSTTVRVAGLETKAVSLGTVLFELDAMVTDGVSAASAAVALWRGRHAETFVEEVNPFLVGLAALVEEVRRAKQSVAVWPEVPSVWDTVTGRLDAYGAAIDVPATPGSSAANPPSLDALALWCASVAERVPTLTTNVDLEGVTAEVTREQPVLLWPASPLSPGGGGTLVNTFGLVETPTVEPPTFTTTVSDPALHVSMPEVSGSVTAIVESAGQLGSFVAGVALAFREYGGDGRLLDVLAERPWLADMLVSGLGDGRVGAESALVILLAYFDEFDRAVTGGTDGRISMDDLWRMMCGGDVPLHVRQAAAVLHDDPHLFNLVETVNDDFGLTQRDVNGGGGDGRVSRRDIETFLQFNEHLAAVEQNFDEFDTAADPGQAADGQISVADLEAVTGGDGQVAVAATWLLAHKGPLTRLKGYEQAREGFSVGPLDDGPITARSVLQLAVDQRVYADAPAQSGDFVDRNLEPLMSRAVGEVTSEPAMAALFDSALTGSDQRGELMQRVIAEVADDGTIHNGGLPLAFANGAAANMSIIDGNINNAFPTADAPAPDGAAETYGDTHDFLREVSRDPAAAHRLRDGLNAYGRTEVAAVVSNDGVAVPDKSEASEYRLIDIGRVQNAVNVAQNEALTSAAEDEIRAALEQPGIGLTPGSTLDYHISTVPLFGVGDLASSANDVAGALGISAGNVLDAVLDSPSERDPLEGLDEAERIDQARLAESAANRAIWVAEARFKNPDRELLDAAAGQPFLDAGGTLKSDPSPEEVRAFRDWAITQSREGGVLHEDVGPLERGVAQSYSSRHDPSGGVNG